MEIVEIDLAGSVIHRYSSVESQKKAGEFHAPRIR